MSTHDVDLTTIADGRLVEMFTEALDEIHAVHQNPDRFPKFDCKITLSLHFTAGKNARHLVMVTPHVDVRTPKPTVESSYLSGADNGFEYDQVKKHQRSMLDPHYFCCGSNCVGLQGHNPLDRAHPASCLAHDDPPQAAMHLRRRPVPFDEYQRERNDNNVVVLTDNN